jgi:hypothetical protein
MAHKVTDSASPEVLLMMYRGFYNKKTNAAIAREIEAATGERINVRTIGRRGFEWRQIQQRRQEKLEDMEALVAAAEKGNLTAAGMIQALATQALLDEPDAFAKQNPLKVQSQNLRAEEIRIKRDTLKLKEREIAVNEAKLQILQEREQRAIAAISESREALTADERLASIREIYGLKPAQQN